MTTKTTPVQKPDAKPAKEQVSQGLIKKRDIYDNVILKTGLRKRDVRDVVDATFAYLRESLAAGKDVQCPPMGKIRVINKDTADGAKTLIKINLHDAVKEPQNAPEK
jgi:nucleoid DNA-binding protein